VAVKTYMLGEVKSLDGEDPNGSFEVILSAPTLDRDGEIIDAKAFEPLPTHIPFDIDHGMSTATTVGSGTPRYEGDVLVVKGTFSSIPRAQEVRTLVTEGHIRTTSVAFMDAQRETKDGVDHVTKAELLNGAFVPIPSNRDAGVLSAKRYAEKVGARNSAADGERMQQIHDLSVSNGAMCEGKSHAHIGDLIVGAEPLIKDITNSTTDTASPGTAADEAAKSPASVDVARARLALASAALSLT
jgi:hypothetical protein